MFELLAACFAEGKVFLLPELTEGGKKQVESNYRFLTIHKFHRNEHMAISKYQGSRFTSKRVYQEFNFVITSIRPIRMRLQDDPL
jgi:hypothetical protein